MHKTRPLSHSAQAFLHHTMPVKVLSNGLSPAGCPQLGKAHKNEEHM